MVAGTEGERSKTGSHQIPLEGASPPIRRTLKKRWPPIWSILAHLIAGPGRAGPQPSALSRPIGSHECDMAEPTTSGGKRHATHCFRWILIGATSGVLRSTSRRRDRF